MEKIANNETLERIKSDAERIYPGKSAIAQNTQQVYQNGAISEHEYLNSRGLYTHEQVIASINASLKEAAENAVQWDIKVNGQQRIDPSAITDEKNIKLL